jgi:hypothetical protein
MRRFLFGALSSARLFPFQNESSITMTQPFIRETAENCYGPYLDAGESRWLMTALENFNCVAIGDLPQPYREELRAMLFYALAREHFDEGGRMFLDTRRTPAITQEDMAP